LNKNDLLSTDDDDVEVGSLPPPQMTVDITSSDVLQLTITKTSLEVFNNLAQVYCDSLSTSIHLRYILIIWTIPHHLKAFLFH